MSQPTYSHTTVHITQQPFWLLNCSNLILCHYPLEVFNPQTFPTFELILMYYSSNNARVKETRQMVSLDIHPMKETLPRQLQLLYCLCIFSNTDQGVRPRLQIGTNYCEPLLRLSVCMQPGSCSPPSTCLVWRAPGTGDRVPYVPNAGCPGLELDASECYCYKKICTWITTYTVYCNTVFHRLDATLEQSPPSNRSCTIGSSEQNKRRPQIVAAVTICSTRTCVLIFVATLPCSWAVCVLRPISTADSRTGRLRVLLPVSIRPNCIPRMYLFQSSMLSASFPTK